MARYSIWVLEYCYNDHYPMSAMVYGAHNQGVGMIPNCYVVVKGEGHVAMVDVGYNNKDFAKEIADLFGVAGWQSPEAVMAEIGLSPKDVDTALITHAHFDHFGNVEAFPNATFYIQERELTKWVWAMSLPSQMQFMLTAVDTSDILRGVELAQKRRLVCVNGAVENVLPGVDLHPAYDTHTFGCMWVAVRNDGKSPSNDTWVLAGDLVYKFDNLGDSGAGGAPDRPYVPVGLAMGSHANLLLATDEMVRTVGGETRRVIPIHETRLKDRFPTRVTKHGLHVTELCLADGETSRI
jgi:N-acyl homoserine lactone hydrolase